MLCKCGVNWRWDWCQDAYCYDDGEFVDTTELVASDDKEHKITVYKCTCDRVNSALVDAPGGAFVLNREEWKDVTWEGPNDCWDA